MDPLFQSELQRDEKLDVLRLFRELPAGDALGPETGSATAQSSPRWAGQALSKLESVDQSLEPLPGMDQEVTKWLERPPGPSFGSALQLHVTLQGPSLFQVEQMATGRKAWSRIPRYPLSSNGLQISTGFSWARSFVFRNSPQPGRSLRVFLD